MKNKISICEIARRLGISKSTVSKALGGKPGVDEETKKNILKYAGSVGYFSQMKEEYDVVALLPASYKGLCGEFQRMMKSAGLEAKCGIYSGEEEYIKALKSLVKLKPKIVALYPTDCRDAESLIKKLEDVWYFGDLLNTENTFYFGVNPKSEAERLARNFLESKCTAPVLISCQKSVIGARRSEIFLRILADNGIYHKGNIAIAESSVISVPFLARYISKYISDADSIYCGDGAAELVPKALKKLGKEEIKVFSYTDEENMKKAVCLLIEKAKIFIESGDYPMCKYNFIQNK